jgi:hypothetical protein
VKILAVDPGLTSGWAALDTDSMHLMTGQSDFNEMVGIAEHYAPTTIVCERYTVTAETLRKSRQTTALEVIGCMRWLAHKTLATFELQSPADAKRFSGDDKLQAAGWLQLKKDDHANDACRHLLLYMVKHKLMELPR